MSPLSLEQSKRKSSRSKADFFEVLVALGLSDRYGLDSGTLKAELKALKKKISKFRNGERRTDEQEKRAKILLPKLVDIIDQELGSIHGEVVNMEWVGRGWQSSDSLSDIDIRFESGDIIGISLKSTRSGRGTQKNIGKEKLKDYLGLDVDSKIKSMW